MSQTKPSVRASTRDEYDWVFEAVTSYIERRFNNDITLDDFLSANAGFSRRSVQRALTHHNTGWRELLTRRRMGHAAMLLRTTNHIVRKIAYRSGYSQPAQFAKAFKRTYGVEPRQYRRQHQRAAA